MFSLEGKTALVTGGTSGIGLAISERFVEAGAAVCIVGRRENGEAVARSIDAKFVRADVSLEVAVIRMFEEAVLMIGAFDILVLNAGVGTLGEPLQSTETGIVEKVTQLNYFGTLFGLKHGPATMRNRGSIICTSSAASYFRLPGFEPYATSKATVDSLVKSAALELGPRGIRVNAVCPAGVATEMAPYDAELDSKLGKLAALGRGFMELIEIVGIFHLLAADEGGFITGQAIRVDGGIGLGCTEALFESL
jgi:3-oxoacyl-[acyl-carrier protein] reductase